MKPLSAPLRRSARERMVRQGIIRSQAVPKPQRADALRIEATLAPYALTNNDRIATVPGP